MCVWSTTAHTVSGFRVRAPVRLNVEPTLLQTDGRDPLASQIDAVNVTTGTFYMTAAGAPSPLLIVAAVARARVIAWTNNTLEQQS